MAKASKISATRTVERDGQLITERRKFHRASWNQFPTDQNPPRYGWVQDPESETVASKPVTKVKETKVAAPVETAKINDVNND